MRVRAGEQECATAFAGQAGNALTLILFIWQCVALYHSSLPLVPGIARVHAQNLKVMEAEGT
jgi:hypothetical protein